MEKIGNDLSIIETNTNEIIKNLNAKIEEITKKIKISKIIRNTIIKLVTMDAISEENDKIKDIDKTKIQNA